MYADDLVLMSESAKGLQVTLNNLQNYCNTWKLSVNLSKTKIIIFNKPGHLKDTYSFKYEDNIIEIVKQYCYLGIEFCASGTFTAAINKQKDQANKALFKLRQYPVNNNVSLSMKLFNSLINPILSYGSEAWSPFLLKGLNSNNFYHLCERVAIETTHVKFCKYVLGVHRKATNAAVRAELGSYPLLIETICKSVKYWIHLQNTKENSLISKCLLQNYQLYSQGQDCWIKHIKD